ncbi:MAG: DUF3656 domain-containing protein [Tissierellia bacterium]|nr:DUF3656 domain-containing protein [Tissierellia bacterium]
MIKTEILAPVGNYEMLLAAISAGADSFYLATDDFGARAYAKNFDIDNIEEIIDYIHLLNKKVYITLNTLIKDKELNKSYEYAKKLYNYGADAFIIQDPGFYEILRKDFKDIQYHASTQMAVRDYEGAKFLKDIGFDRIVIARETPFSEIQKIKKLDIDLEVFIHGSICVCISGECLMSSYLGRRSANRGKCAGPCRKMYEIENPNGEKITKIPDYFLNMRDLSTIDMVDRLEEIGVDSLKIEGRMKTAEYVYNSVKSYKDKLNYNRYDKDNLIDISNRGYTKGFIFGENKDFVSLKKDQRKHRMVGRIIDSNGKKIKLNSDIKDKTIVQITTDKNKNLPFTATRDYKAFDTIDLVGFNDAKINSKVYVLNSSKAKFSTEYEKLEIDMKFVASVGKKAYLTIKYNDYEVSVSTQENIDRAKKINIRKEDILENLSKLNETIYELKNCNIDIDDDIFIKKKDINKLRRSAIEILNNKRLEKCKHNLNSKYISNNINKQFEREINIEIKNTKNIDLDILKDYDNIYVREYSNELLEFDNIYYILEMEKIDVDKFIKFIKDNNIKGVVINNYSYLYYLNDFIENNIKIRIGRKTNSFNSETFKYYDKFSEMICSSVECDFDSINDFSKSYPTEVMVYGRLDVMTMKFCPLSTIKSCNLKGCENCNFKKGYFLINEENDKFLIERTHGYTKLYPNDYMNVDIKKLDKSVSLLYVLNDDRKFTKRKIANINYDRGVI